MVVGLLVAVVFPDFLRDFGLAEMGETSSNSLGDVTEFL